MFNTIKFTRYFNYNDSEPDPLVCNFDSKTLKEKCKVELQKKMKSVSMGLRRNQRDLCPKILSNGT